MATRSKLQSVSARRSSSRTRSGAVPAEAVSTPATCSRFVPNPNSTPGTDKTPRTPFSVKAITPIGGTLKSVSLSDWWLTNEKGLGVAGFESKGGSEVRLFSSATISTRHDSTTLETSDGLTLSISGFINRSRSLQNGFPLEVCNRFLLGFPYHWKDYIEEGFVEKDYGVSFDDIPVNRLQDFLFTASPRLQDKILCDAVTGLRDLLRSSTKKPDKECEGSDKECQKPRMDEESLVVSVGRVQTRGMLRRREEDSTEKPDKECERSDKECQKPIMDDGDEESLVVSVEGVKTRGMLRRREGGEASIEERLHRSSNKKRDQERRLR